ncbi:MAG: MATE family efflux transporter [Muribaculaceae bacterium]|nr:MATE family efflux transporter [Muribaculaceae bacterium]
MTLRREILSIALPAIVATITTPLLGLVDVAITGHIGEARYLAAIAVGGAMFNMLYWLFNFLRMGTTGLTAQAFGAHTDTSIILWRSLAIAFGIGLAMIALQDPIAYTVLRFMDADAATAYLAREYFSILIWGAPAVIMTYALSGWFLGMQDSRAQMWTAIATNVLNIGTSLALVYGLKMKIAGVACGTLVAQWGGLTVAAVLAWKRYHPHTFSSKGSSDMPVPSRLEAWLRLVFEPRALMRFFRINSDIFLRTSCLVAVTLWFTHVGASLGTDILAANAILMQLFMFFSFFMDGFAFAGEALAGKHSGSGRHDMVGRLVKALMRIGGCGALVFSVCYYLGGEEIIRLLTDEPTVRTVAVRYLPWAGAIPLCGFAAFVWDGIFVGLVDTRSLLLSMATALIVFAAVKIAAAPMGNDGLWLAFDAYLLTRGIVLSAVFYRKYHSKMTI